MIAAMKRAFILVSEKDRREAAKKLRSLGIVHLEEMHGQGEEFELLTESAKKLEDALNLIKEYGPQEGPEKLERREALDLADEILSLNNELKDIFEKDSQLKQEAERLKEWGQFEPSLLNELAEEGIPIRLATIPARRLEAIKADFDFLTIAVEKGRARLAFLAGPEDPIPEDAVEFRVPEQSLLKIMEARQEIETRSAEYRSRIAEAAPLESAIKHELKQLEREVKLERVRSGALGNGHVFWFAGWVPEKDRARLEEKAARNSWALILDDPQEDELPPTKVENNAIVRVIQPVFDFLGTVPNYREYDISGLFLLFFVIFFAMIFGDGGYGGIMLFAGIAAAISSKRKTGRVADPVRLLLMLASATVGWGILTGSWFGIPGEQLPEFLNKLALPALSGLNPESGDNIKFVCFGIGIVQLVIAHFKNIMRDIKSPAFLGELGQAAMVFGIYWVVLNLVISSAKYPIPMWALAVAGAGFVLNILFGSYDGSKGFFGGILASIISSLANIVSVFLGVVNIFADLVSYIRLWAVGLAGVGISSTVNQMAGPMVGKFSLWLIGGIVLLGFGHGLNIILSVLSVIVHGVRLNMLEFSGHLGMEWSGYKYEPFMDTVPTGRVTDERSPS